MSQDYTVGQKLGDYEILGILGAGGMGKVYKVRNTISDRVEAMKILLPDLAGQKDLADRFLREIKVLASLNHPNIAALRTALTLDNQLVMIMEFVDGVTLSSRLQQGAIPPTQAVKYIDQVLDALSYAHKQNVIHRDIKPANMMLTPDGVVKLMDFGIARSGSDRSLTMTGTTLGSLNYMPPEQVKGEPADNRSDLYSLGVSLYEMVTGQLPFTADSNYAMMAAHLQEVPKPPIVLRPGIPQTLNQIIVMALAKEPGQRFQSADAFRGALKSVQAQGGGTQPEVNPRSYAPSAPAHAGSATSLFNDSPASSSPTTMMDAPVFQSTDRVPSNTPAPVFASAPPPTREAAPQLPSPAIVGNKSHRGLYIALGAFIVVVVLFAAGLYLPMRIKTMAGAGKARSTPQTSQSGTGSSVTPPLSVPSSTPGDTTIPPTPPTDPNAQTPGGATGSGSGSASGSTGAQSPQTGQSSTDNVPDPNAPSTSPNSSSGTSGTSSNSGSAQPSRKPGAGKSKKDAQASEADAQAKAEAAAQADEVEKLYDDIDGRSTAVSQSLDNLQKQQAASGYGLRGDIVAAQQRMKTDISKAQAAMQKQDTKSAKKYLDMAEAELSTLEKFLGK
jgi:serine/threonine-protein kinase